MKQSNQPNESTVKKVVGAAFVVFILYFVFSDSDASGAPSGVSTPFLRQKIIE